MEEHEEIFVKQGALEGSSILPQLTMQEELGVEANSLGRTAIYLFQREYFEVALNIT